MTENAGWVTICLKDRESFGFDSSLGRFEHKSVPPPLHHHHSDVGQSSVLTILEVSVSIRFSDPKMWNKVFSGHKRHPVTRCHTFLLLLTYI